MGDMAMTSQPLPRRDRVTLVLLSFFILMAWTVELYWLVYNDQLSTRAENEWLARVFQVYSAADAAYFDHVTPLTRFLEGFHVLITAPLMLCIVYAIVQRRPYRHSLQLVVASVISYSTFLYLIEGHLSGYARMQPYGAGNLLLFILPNLPWLLGGLYLGYDSVRAINRRFAVVREWPASTPAEGQPRLGARV